MIAEDIAAVLALIEQILPLLGSNASGPIQSIIDILTQWLPRIISLGTVFAQTVKNIIASLSANPTATSDQLLALQQLDAQVDVAFETAATGIDPDAG